VDFTFSFADGVQYAFRHPTRHHDKAYYVLFSNYRDLYADPRTHEFKDNPLAAKLALQHFKDKDAVVSQTFTCARSSQRRGAIAKI
jgi:hypothetical protein